MLKRSAIAGVLAALGLVALATNAEAATMKELFAYSSPSSGGAFNTLDDVSAEEIIQRDGNASLDVGDSLFGIINFTTIENAEVSGGVDPLGAAGNSEFSGIFMTRVIGKSAAANSDGEFTFAFGPDPAFEATFGTGAIVALYEDSSPDFTQNNYPTGATDVGNATDGTLFWVLGFLGSLIDPDGTPANGDEITDLDEGWIAVALDSVPAGVPGTSFGEFNLAVNRILFPGADGNDLILGLLASNFGGNGGVHFKGSGQPLLPSAGTNWPVSDNTRVDFLLIVPLPAAAWAGFAMLGLLGVGRKLRRRSA